MSIQRYGFVMSPHGCDDCDILKVNHGDYVLYTDHAAEVERLTAERDALKAMDRTQCPNCNNCIRDLREDKSRLLSERDAAVARAETLENGILSAMDYWNRCEEPGAMSDALYEIENRLNAALAAYALAQGEDE